MNDKITNEFKLKLFDFHPLTEDRVFKYLWLNGEPNTIKFFNRVIKRIVGYDISNFSFYYNEVMGDKDISQDNRLDFLLVSEDETRRLNIELNRFDRRYWLKRNEFYLHKIAGNFYNQGDKLYTKDLLVDQVNINAFSDKDYDKLDLDEYSIRNQIGNRDLRSIRIFNIFLPVVSNICYNNDIEMLLDYKMFMAQSFEEMEEIAKGNKERMSVMKDLKRRIIYGEDFETEEARMAYRKAAIRGIKEDAREEGIKEGIKEGRQEAKNDIINKLLSSGMSKKELSKRLGMPIL